MLLMMGHAYSGTFRLGRAGGKGGSFRSQAATYVVTCVDVGGFPRPQEGGHIWHRPQDVLDGEVHINHLLGSVPSTLNPLLYI